MSAARASTTASAHVDVGVLQRPRVDAAPASPARPGRLERGQAFDRRRAHREVRVLQVSAQRVRGIGALRLADRLQHADQRAGVLLLQHRLQDARAGLVADLGQGGREPGAHRRRRVGIEAREHQREVVAVHLRQREQRGGAHRGQLVGQLAHDALAQAAVRAAARPARAGLPRGWPRSRSRDARPPRARRAHRRPAPPRAARSPPRPRPCRAAAAAARRRPRGP